jgi:hypothetical protein
MNVKELNISIFSYNIFWKIMKNNNSPLEKTLGLSKLSELKSNIISNITNVINYYNPFIYCFQEAECVLDIIKLFSKLEYEYHLGYSEPEHILTVWRKDVIKKKIVLDGEFEPGRPFSIIVFNDLRYKNYWMLINIHASHNPHTNLSIFEPIQNLIDINQNLIKQYMIMRIVITGDFNRDIRSQIKIDPLKLKLKINSAEYYFNTIENTTNKTCCSLKGWGYKLNYDQTIDSYYSPLLIHQLNKECWYIPESSDHLATLSIIKNFIK